MRKYKALAITTSYWKPGDSYLDHITEALDGEVENDDFVVVSEKALSTARGNIVDESRVKPNISARFMAVFWMRTIWGYPLGVLCDFGPRLLRRLRTYPQESGSRHKQVALERPVFCRRLCLVLRAESTDLICPSPT